MHYLTLDVFTGTRFGGNQLAVFPDARAIPEGDLLAICREFNYSEVVFCYPPADAANTKRLRIFTPGGELPFAGHPIVGTATALALKENALGGATTGAMRFECGVGLVPVDVTVKSPTLAWAEFSAAKMPEIGPQVPTLNTLAEILSVEPSDLVGGALSPQAVSCGLPFLIVPLKTVAAVSKSRVRVERWEQTLAKAWASMLLVVAKDPNGGEHHWHARMFAPGINVPEDPATGSAIAALGGWLALKDSRADAYFSWTVDQGVEMGRPSRLEVRAEKKGGAVTTVKVAGEAVLMGEGALI